MWVHLLAGYFSFLIGAWGTSRLSPRRPYLAMLSHRHFPTGKLAPSEKKLASSLDKQFAVEMGGIMGGSVSGSLDESSHLGGSFGGELSGVGGNDDLLRCLADELPPAVCSCFQPRTLTTLAGLGLPTWTCE